MEKNMLAHGILDNNINLSVLKLAQLGKKIFNSKSKIIIKKNKKKINTRLNIYRLTQKNL